MAAPVAAIRFILTRAAGLSAVAVAMAAAAAPMSSREAFMGGHLADQPTGPPTARYQTDEGGVFILDRSSSKTLLKFENDPEIWVLDRQRGPHGDWIYRNDLGEEMLRATSLGGFTIFTVRRPEGSPAAFDGVSPPLRVGPVSPMQLTERFYQDSVRATQHARHEIVFETGKDADPSTAGPVADAAAVASEALVDVASRPNGRLILSRIDDVVITQGGKPNAALQKNRLVVTIVPKQGVAGRPSSRRIERATGAP
jgi:Domain of unknown function (DUF4908)